jgi:hypothetical protein
MPPTGGMIDAPYIPLEGSNVLLEDRHVTVDLPDLTAKIESVLGPSRTDAACGGRYQTAGASPTIRHARRTEKACSRVSPPSRYTR